MTNFENLPETQVMGYSETDIIFRRAEHINAQAEAARGQAAQTHQHPATQEHWRNLSRSHEHVGRVNSYCRVPMDWLVRTPYATKQQF